MLKTKKWREHLMTDNNPLRWQYCPELTTPDSSWLQQVRAARMASPFLIPAPAAVVRQGSTDRWVNDERILWVVVDWNWNQRKKTLNVKWSEESGLVAGSDARKLEESIGNANNMYLAILQHCVLSWYGVLSMQKARVKFISLSFSSFAGIFLLCFVIVGDYLAISQLSL